MISLSSGPFFHTKISFLLIKYLELFPRVSYYAQGVHRPVRPADRSWPSTEVLPGKQLSEMTQTRGKLGRVNISEDEAAAHLFPLFSFDTWETL